MCVCVRAHARVYLYIYVCVCVYVCVTLFEVTRRFYENSSVNNEKICSHD